MHTVKITHNGNSQNVRLSRGFQFDADEVEILRRGDEVILRKKQHNLREAFELLASMPDDFFRRGDRPLCPSNVKSSDCGALSPRYQYLHLHRQASPTKGRNPV